MSYNRAISFLLFAFTCKIHASTFFQNFYLWAHKMVESRQDHVKIRENEHWKGLYRRNLICLKTHLNAKWFWFFHVKKKGTFFFHKRITFEQFWTRTLRSGNVQPLRTSFTHLHIWDEKKNNNFFQENCLS